ncbi:hypothetical protein SNE40_010303 [Patella caerulea]|uniref:Amine oxidase n=1 Tax=Patella caerulea TaxID=87958 RepID=A0AAN8JVP5_PATCE
MDEKLRKSVTRWRLASAVLVVLCALLIILVIGIVMNKNREILAKDVPSCGLRFKSNMDTSEPEHPDIFHDLTSREMKAVQNYLISVPELNLELSNLRMNSSYIAGIDYILPPKKDVLAYLDDSRPPPARKAKVIILRGDLTPPMVEEYVVAPLSNPSYHTLIDYPNRRNPVPFSMRPFTGIEFKGISEVMKKVDAQIGDILRESYGATFNDCGDKCLFFNPNVVSSAITGDFTRRMWLQVAYLVEFYTIHPVDLLLYVNVDGSDPSQFRVEKVVYGGQYRNSLAELAADYVSGDVVKSKMAFPTVDKNLFSTLHRRGFPASPTEEQRQPQFVEPDGARYRIKHRQIEYMNWRFHVRMATYNGPQIHDVRFAGKRIAYEIGLQEIAAFYAGDAPTFRMANYIDSVASLGQRARALVPSVDCPETATYLSTRQVSDNQEGSVKSERSFCVFELNTGYPLRRHLEYLQFRGSFYGGMVDNCLIVRTILCLNNYDYIIDFIFHQSGIVETKIVSTGYIYGGVYNDQEKNYGFQIADQLVGNIHHHLFNFKVDLDVMGTSNRYETLDIKLVNVSNSKWLNGLNTIQSQIKFDRSLKKTELDAVYKYNFDTPKEHIFHNNAFKTRFNEPRAYKVQLSGMSKQILPEDKLNERSIPWARYQMAVTKYSDNEVSSSSIYGNFDGLQPVVNFTQYLADDENIVDEDLVLWMTMGMYHIPHSEDLPLTQTPGKHLTFLISPHNYFPEDPSMSSRDQVRVQLKEPSNPKAGVRVDRYFNKPNTACVSNYKETDFDKDVEENPCNILDV